MGLLDQLSAYPLTALLTGAILLVSFLLVVFKRTERSALFTRLLGLALLAWFIGIVSSVRSVIDVFRAVALAGSGGRGTVAAGLAESLGAFLLGLVPALLVLLALLVILFYRRAGAVGSPDPGEPRREASRWALIYYFRDSSRVAQIFLGGKGEELLDAGLASREEGSGKESALGGESVAVALGDLADQTV